RVRTNVFFVFVFPMLLILILGLAFGGSGEARVGVVAARPRPLGQALLDGLAATKGIEVRVVAGEARLVSDIEHGLLAGGLVIPADYDATLAAGGTVTVRYVAQSGTSGRQLGRSSPPWSITRPAGCRRPGSWPGSSPYRSPRPCSVPTRRRPPWHWC